MVGALALVVAVAVLLDWQRFVPAGPARVVAIAAGGGHTCALTSAGEVKCWGDNSSGQLGDGTRTDRTEPVDVVGLRIGAKAIAAGSYQLGGGHTCALTTTGGVKCWGDNSDGQLGDGQVCGLKCATPVDVKGLASGVVAITAGGRHTCALTTGGGVKCWGDNGKGRLGDGTTTSRTTPVDVVGLTSGVAAVAAGGGVNVFQNGHTCAVTTAGAVRCWGANEFGQLGDGTETSSTVPVDVVGLSGGVEDVATGGMALHTCALTTAGGVKCWGANFLGQMGDNTLGDRTRPLDVKGLASGVAAVTAAGANTCVVMQSGGAKCWGWNADGQLGQGTRSQRSTPVDLTGLGSGVIAVIPGGFHTCALTSAGRVKCWGANGSGQLGDGTTVPHYTPVDVIGFGG